MGMIVKYFFHSISCAFQLPKEKTKIPKYSCRVQSICGFFGCYKKLKLDFNAVTNISSGFSSRKICYQSCALFIVKESLSSLTLHPSVTLIASIILLCLINMYSILEVLVCILSIYIYGQFTETEEVLSDDKVIISL